MVMTSKVELIVARNQFLDEMLNNFIARGSAAGLKDQVGIIECSSARCWRQLSRSTLRRATVGSVADTGDRRQSALLLAQPTSLAPHTASADFAAHLLHLRAMATEAISNRKTFRRRHSD
ncbi:hypothetical protein ATY77_08360 [Rhizobium sp. R634]|nr:hypothetical protein ATY77_07110 [Rhizobium sp. R634]OWV73227.1 hypothetical protein ATY77_08360 [Rhizobium sp. R634]